MKKQVILFKTHILNRNILNEFEKIKKDCLSLNFDIFLLYDNSKKDFYNFDLNHFLFDIDDFSTTGYSIVDNNLIPKGKNIAWFHADFPVLLFFNKNRNYDFYWQIEFDVRFNGDWKDFFVSFDKIKSDFVSSFIYTYGISKEWISWSKYNIFFENKLLKHSPFPIIRFSNIGLYNIDIEYRNNNIIGWCEVSCPTIINNKGLTLYSFGNNFCNKFTFQFRHPITYNIYRSLSLFPQTKGKLFHPIVPKNFFIFLRSVFGLYYILGKIGILLSNISPGLYKLLKPYFPDKK